MGGPVGKPHLLQGADTELLTGTAGESAVKKGQFHIFIGGQGGDQVEPLEDESDLPVADPAQLRFAAKGEIPAA